jgi:hypothetical protein
MAKYDNQKLRNSAASGSLIRHDADVEWLHASLDASSNSPFQLDEEHLQNYLSGFN